MNIFLTKISDDRHRLDVKRENGSRDGIELESKSTLVHDFLHFALESSIGTQEGFWGALAAGKTLADMNDRSGASMREYAGTMADIEQLVGALTNVAKGTASADEIIAAVRNMRAAAGKPVPDWFNAQTIEDVRERMRKLQGHWNATPFGGIMELTWNL